MKKKALLLLGFALFISSYAEDILLTTKFPRSDENEVMSYCGGDSNKVMSYCEDSCNTCAPGCPGPRGPRGQRGRRGRRGRRGPQGEQGDPGTTTSILLTEELFINAPMITNATGDTPDMSFAFTYGIPTVLEAWSMPFPLLTSNPAFGTQLLIPANLDRTQPVSLTLHFFNAETVLVGDIRLEVQVDYMQNNEVIGVNPPADGYSETIETGNITITSPSGPNNLRYFTVTIPLDASLMVNKTWAVITVSRIFTTNENDYPDEIYLAGMSLRYTRRTT